jgi:hypothetical protein
MACSWYRDSNWVFRGTVEFNDPTQGGAGNCALHAGLCSAVWWNPGLVVDNSRSWTDPQGNVCKSYQVTLYKATGGLQDVFVTDYLKWNSDFCWGKSKTPQEIWVGIYEKAYAAFLLGTYGTSTSPIHMPTGWADSGTSISGSTVWPQYSLTPLKNLTGMRNEGPNGPASTSNLTAIQIFNQLFTSGAILYCKPALPWVRYKLTRPIVAWTGINVVSPAIVTQHTYSVLGLVKNNSLPNDDQNNYIVLRNPQGTVSTLPTNNSGNNFCGIYLDGTNGVFALSALEFKNNFTAYGWVY